MAEWFPACRLEDVPEGRGLALSLGGLTVALFLVDGLAIALSDRCPHAGGSLGQGWFEDGEVVCPLHRWRFRPGDGRCTTMRGQGVHRFRSEVRDDTVWVEI